MTRAQKRFYDACPPDGWPWEVLSGPERAMAQRMVDAGHMALWFKPFVGEHYFRTDRPPAGCRWEKLTKEGRFPCSTDI